MNYTLCLLLLVTSVQSRADVRLPAILTSHMVLQQKADVAIWGWANPAEKVTVTASWDNQPVTTTTTDMGGWKLTLHTPGAGGPHSLTIAGTNTLVLTDVLLGEVWLCAGQSNMEWSASLGIKDAQAELPAAYNPNIRFFDMPSIAAETPQQDTKGNWAVCDSVSLKNFSAVGYFFGKKLAASLNVPIGLIDAGWGGSYMESWIPESAVQLFPATKRSAELMSRADKWPSKPGYIFNGMVAPITNVRLAGAIWYQGESNRHYPQAYYQLTHLMVDTWRGVWQTDFPFYYVQIAPFAYNEKFQTAAVREVQTRTMDMPKSGMIVTTDLVDDLKNIHPAYKKEVGNRLAGWALAETYAKSVAAYKSPAYRSMQVDGNTIRLSFDHVPTTLVMKGAALAEFEIAGEDRVFVKAQARLKGRQVEVSADAVKKPVAVRFAFSDAPQPNLFSQEGLPVIPFRTDTWDLGLRP